MPDRNDNNTSKHHRMSLGVHGHTCAARTAAPRPGGRGLVAQRGSLLILCVTVLVIIALVGIAFLQRVRLDQAATARHERQYMDLVINGILADIGQQMTSDIFENANNGKELYDYPWTKQVQEVDATFINNSTIKVNGAGFGGVPDHEDDRWLASTAPVLKSPPGAYHWLHLTNLTGIWLDLEANNPEQPINGPVSNILSSDTDINLALLGSIPPGRSEPLGVDADGDGVYDSRWQWVPVPVRDFGGRKFIMAARIVDLNAMLNVNTAIALSGDGLLTNDINAPRLDPTDAATTPRGYSPAWADLARLSARWVTPQGNTVANVWSGELTEVFKHRISNIPATQIGTIDLTTGINLLPREVDLVWEQQASIYGNLDRNFVADSEVELRRFGGVNDLSIESPLEQRMPRLLRQTPAPAQPEASYRDVVLNLAGVPVNPPANDNAAIGHWFYGHQNGDSEPVVDRRFAGLRHWLTTASGVGDFVTKYGGFNSPLGVRKYDLRHELGGSQNDAIDLRDTIRVAFTLPEPGAPSPQWYLGNNIASPETMDDLVNEYAMCIEDYADEDSIPGGFNQGELNGAGVAYGLERLPFLREAYLHVLYTDEDLNDGAGGPPDGAYDTWQAKDDTEAVAIELGNPFAHRIDVSKPDSIINNIKVVVIQNGVEISSWILDNNVPDIDARNDNGADSSDLLILICNQLGQTVADENGQMTGRDLATDLNINTPNLVTLPDGQLFFNPDGSNVTIELQVDVSGNGSGKWVTYDRMNTRLSFDKDVPHGPSATPNTKVASQHGQASFWRNKQNINYISIDTGDDNAVNLPDITSATGAFSAGTHQMLTDASAPGGTWTMPAGFQLPLADQPIRSVAELAWIHMFGFTDIQPFSERVGDPALNAPNPGRHFLVIDAADPDYRVLNSPSDPADPGAGIPHAAVLMDLFTVNGTHEDGLDNDNDDGDNDPKTAATAQPGQTEASIDNKTERFIPGMINVNTAPLHILTLGTPLAEGIADTEVLMRLIIGYRDLQVRSQAGYADDPKVPGPDSNLRNIIRTLYGVDRQFKPGIASIGELMYMGLSNADLPFNMQRYAYDGNPLPAALDLYPDPSEAGASSVSTGDDNEQRMARFQMLSQTLTTRSDRFAVYVVIRGYDWNPGSGPISGSDLAESAQFIAIFDRGSMEDKDDSPRVIGFVRLQ